MDACKQNSITPAREIFLSPLFTSANVFAFVCFFVCHQDDSVSCQRILTKYLEGQDVICNSWLDFGDDPEQDADIGIFERNFYHCGIGWDNFTNFADNSRSWQIMKIFEGYDVSLAKNHSILVLIIIRMQENFSGIFTISGTGKL